MGTSYDECKICSTKELTLAFQEVKRSMNIMYNLFFL